MRFSLVAFKVSISTMPRSDSRATSTVDTPAGRLGAGAARLRAAPHLGRRGRPPGGPHPQGRRRYDCRNKLAAIISTFPRIARSLRPFSRTPSAPRPRWRCAAWKRSCARSCRRCAAGQPADEQLRLPIFQQVSEGLGRARHLGGRQHAHGARHPLAGIAHGHPHAHFPCFCNRGSTSVLAPRGGAEPPSASGRAEERKAVLWPFTRRR